MPGCVSEYVPFSGGGGGDGISRGITNTYCVWVGGGGGLWHHKHILFLGGGAMASQTPLVMGCQFITNTNKFWGHTLL